MVKALSTATDWSWHLRAQDSIAHAALTNSKRPSCLIKGVYPTHLSHGRGALVFDPKGKAYVDFICGLGTNLLGYGQSEVCEAAALSASLGSCLSLGTTLEVEAAEKVKELFPFVDLVRFLKTGSDACSASLRIARAYTGRKLVLSEGYHGWGDEFVALTPPALGVAVDSWIEHLYKADSELWNDVAAVIVEPIMTESSPERVAYLRRLREKCDQYGVVLIFDEVITGFRFPKYSVAEHYGIRPDLICIGKAMGNGFPISAVGGKREIMDCGEYFVSSTFAGETGSLAAALKTMTLLQTKYSIQELWEQGMQFLGRFNELWPEKVRIEGYPARGTFKGDDLVKALLWQEACRAGILFGPSWFLSFAHKDHLHSVLETCRDIIVRIKTGAVKLEGDMPSSPFAQRMREIKA